MYVYECPRCGGTSDPYLTRARADQFGAEHREQEHAGLHPAGECILKTEHRAPQGREWVAVALVLFLIGAALLTR